MCLVSFAVIIGTCCSSVRDLPQSECEGEVNSLGSAWKQRQRTQHLELLTVVRRVVVHG